MGYFNSAFGNPGTGNASAFATPPNSVNPAQLAALMSMQNGGAGGAAPQLPSPLGKAGSNAGAMPSPIASQPNLLAQLMANPGMLQNLLKGLNLGGGGVAGGGLGALGGGLAGQGLGGGPGPGTGGLY